MLLATEVAAMRRGWVWPMIWRRVLLQPPLPKAKAILGSWVVLPEPVSPQTMMTWFACMAAMMSSRRSLTGRFAGNSMAKVLGAMGDVTEQIIPRHGFTCYTCLCETVSSETIMANLTISLDENLVKLARIKAIQEGTSLSAKVREMLAAYVRQDLPSTPLAIPKLPTGGSGGLMPGIDPSSNRSFYEAMDADMDILKLR
jgi:hypothetical protein